MSTTSVITQQWVQSLSNNGCRVTKPRCVILDIIARSERPLTPQEIHALAAAKSPGIGLVTVYRTIDKLEEMEMVERVHHTGQCQTIFRRAVGHKHLLICTQCGRSVHFEGLEFEKEFQLIAQKHGFCITSHWLQLSGLCADCQKGKNT